MLCSAFVIDDMNVIDVCSAGHPIRSYRTNFNYAFPKFLKKGMAKGSPLSTWMLMDASTVLRGEHLYVPESLADAL